MTYEEAKRAFEEECAEIEDYCVEQGYPSNGSTFDLMVESIMPDYPELFS